MSKLYRLDDADRFLWDMYKRNNGVPDWFESTSDGCTCAPDLTVTLGCLIHDWEYYLGGTLFDKIRSDLRLYRFMRYRGYIFYSLLYLLGTSIGGLVLWNYRLSPLKDVK